MQMLCSCMMIGLHSCWIKSLHLCKQVPKTQQKHLENILYKMLIFLFDILEWDALMSATGNYNRDTTTEPTCKKRGVTVGGNFDVLLKTLNSSSLVLIVLAFLSVRGWMTLKCFFIKQKKKKKEKERERGERGDDEEELKQGEWVKKRGAEKGLKAGEESERAFSQVLLHNQQEQTSSAP